jgi:hypothetical protein
LLTGITAAVGRRKNNRSHGFAGQKIGIKEVSETI